MEFPKKARYAIVLSSALLLAAFSSYISIHLLFNERFFIILFAGVTGLTIASVSGLERYTDHVLRTEFPRCPVRREDYTASQEKWVRAREKQFFSSGKPFLFIVCFLAVVFGGIEGSKLLLTVLKSAPHNVQFWSAVIVPLVASFLGIIYGNWGCNRRQKFLSELMAVPEQEPVKDELQSYYSSLPPIPSPYKLPWN